MALTKLQIWNAALGTLGQAVQLTSTTTDNPLQRACAAFYDLCRDTLQEERVWNCTTRRATSVTSPTPPASYGVLTASLVAAPTNWGYAYELPADCLVVRKIVNSRRVERADQRIPFEVATEWASTTPTRHLYCDLEAVEIIYSAKVEEEAAFDAMFTSALRLLLATEIAPMIKADVNMARRALQLYGQVISAASARNGNEGQDLTDVSSEFLDVRQ